MKEISDWIVDLDEFNMVEEFGEGSGKLLFTNTRKDHDLQRSS